MKSRAKPKRRAKPKPLKLKAIRDRIVGLRRVKASTLSANPRNWRTHPQAQQEALKAVLAEIGYADVLLTRELPDGKLEIIDGHLRAETTPDQQVPVLVLDVDEHEADTLLATLDPLAAMAEANKEKLDSLLREVQTGDEMLTKMLDDLAKTRGIAVTDVSPTPDPEPQIDRAAELQKEWGTASGQLWEIAGKAGTHRLLCGDSMIAEDVTRAMAAQGPIP